MKNFIVSQYIFLVLMYAEFAYSHNHYYITPSLNGSCVQESQCLTLSELIDQSHNDENVTILFIPGNHTLDRVLSLTQGNNLTITTTTQAETVFIQCNQQGRFYIRDMYFVSIKNFNFNGCRGNTIIEVAELFMDNTLFHGAGDTQSGSALNLNQVDAANVDRCSFISNILYIGNVYREDNPTELRFRLGAEGFVEWVFFGRRPSRLSDTAAAIFSSFSNVFITESTFVHNEAEQGGVLAVYHSTLNINNSYFSNNTAAFGGVINTERSQIHIYNTSFNNNLALVSGAFMMAHDCSCIISGSNMERNSAFTGGAIIAHTSMFDITESTFTDNTVSTPVNEGRGRIEALVFIINSHFIIHDCDGSKSENVSSAASFIITFGQSFVDVGNSTFKGYHGKIGAVMQLYHEASITISDSVFKDNTATSCGAIAAHTDTALNITNSAFINNRT